MVSPSVQRQLDVLVGDTLVGQIRYTQEGRREHAAFEYAATWLSDPARYKIDPTLPLVRGPQFAPRAVAGWREMAASLGFTREEAESFADAFEHEERAAAQRRMA